EAVALHGGDDRAVVVDVGGRDRVVGNARERVGEVHVAAVEPLEERALSAHAQLVPAHVGNTARTEALDTPREEAETRATLLARAEQELHSHADPEHRPARPDPGGERLVEPALAQAASRAARVSDAGDDGERRRLHLGGVLRDNRIAARTRQRRADAAQVARAVVGEHDPHSAPFVEPPPPLGAHASRSARPTALNAASATWWSSSPAASTCSVSPASTANRSSACGSSVSARPPTRSPRNASSTSACGRRTRSTAAVARASSIGTVAEP